MNKFEAKIKPLLTYIGTIGASLMCVAYMILVVVLIKGFQVQATSQTILFAIVNAVVGLLVANFLKYQGISFARTQDESVILEKEYYGTRTKNKKAHGLRYFWITSVIKDIFVKGTTTAATTTGIVYIIIVGSNDWNLLLLAFVNLIMFICFGLLALNKAYDYYNNVFKTYMKEQLKETQNERKDKET